MAKEFLDEVIEALNELRFAEARRVYDAVKNKERPPITMKPATVMKTVYQVAANHQITREDLMCTLGTSDLTGAQMQTMQQIADSLNET